MRARFIPFALLTASLACAAGSSGNHATLVSIVSAQKDIDGKLAHLWPDEPMFVLGPARGVFLKEYGAVFTAEIYLAPAPVSVVIPNPTKDMIASYHRKKLERLPQLEQAMRDLLAQTASSLNNLGDSDHVVLAVDLPTYAWEETDGVPAEIVMKASKSALAAASKDQLASVIQTEEY